MARFPVGLVLVLHGLIHLMGFAVYLRLAAVEGLAYPGRLLGGLLPAPGPVVAALGVGWLIAALGFVIGGGALLLRRPGWLPFVVGAAALSLALCLLGWPEARFGAVVDAAILIALVAAPALNPAWRPAR